MPRALLLLLLAGAACVDTLPPLDETTSLKVELLAPADPGSPDVRLPDADRTVMIQVSAFDAQNQPDPRVTGRSVQVYVQFLGSLTPAHDARIPFATIPMTNGTSAPTQLVLPPVFGPTTVWVEDNATGGSFAAGTSPALWFREPTTSDISTPRDPAALDALSASPLQNKQVTVKTSRYGARGRMVVTGTYAQGYSVSDVECADAMGHTPCTTGDYDHVLVFSFSRPKDEQGRNIEMGQFIDGYGGAVQEFNGLTEMGFPQSFVSDTSIDLARLPTPPVVQRSWLTSPIEFEKRESSPIAIEGATVCPLDDDFTTYKQWKLDLGSGCGAAINVITNGVIDFDPATRVGQTVTRVVGILRPVNIGTFNVFIIYPRNSADLVL